MDDVTDDVLGGLTAGSLAICCLCIVFYAIRGNRRPLKHSRSDTNLALNSEEPVVVHRDSDPGVEF